MMNNSNQITEMENNSNNMKAYYEQFKPLFWSTINNHLWLNWILKTVLKSL